MVGRLSQYEHINSNTTTNLVDGRAILKRIVLNDIGSSWNLKVYDDTGTGTSRLIADITPSQNATLEYDIKTTTGLTVVSSGSSAGSATVLFEGE